MVTIRNIDETFRFLPVPLGQIDRKRGTEHALLSPTRVHISGSGAIS